jgi:hypothetical protein
VECWKVWVGDVGCSIGGGLPVHYWNWPATSVTWVHSLRNASELPPGPL